MPNDFFFSSSFEFDKNLTIEIIHYGYRYRSLYENWDWVFGINNRAYRKANIMAWNLVYTSYNHHGKIGYWWP